MALHLVLLFTILAFALVSIGQCVSSPTNTSTTTPKSSPHPDTSMPGTIQLPTTEPTSTTTTATPPTITNTTSTTTTKSCPHSGYQLYPEFNCYKAFLEERTWSEARDQCVRDGGDLMAMETEREIQDVYLPLYYSVRSRTYLPWVGVHIPEGEDGWMTVNGEPALSTWWASGNPVKNAARKCAFAVFTGQLLNWDCADTLNFICEISL